MPTSRRRDQIDARQWEDIRGHGQPSQGYLEQLPDFPATSPDTPSTSDSVDTDPSEDSSDDPVFVPDSIELISDSVGENSPNSVAELGLRDISDPGPEGSHQGHGGRRVVEPGSPGLDRRSRPGLVRPNRRGIADRPAQRTSSGSPSVTSRRQERVMETPPRRERPGRAQSHSRWPIQEERPRRIEDRGREEPEGLVLSRRHRRSASGRRNAPSPPDFLRMVMTMQQLGTTKFYGDKGPMEADSWLKHIERNFEATRCPDSFKTDVAVHYLMGDASNWWGGVKYQHAGAQVTWDRFRREFERKYFPPEARDRMEAQFQSLVQGPRSVREYEAEFTRLRPYAHYGVAEEPVVIRKFLRGLRPELRSRLVVIQFCSLFELVERAVDVEECIHIEQAAERRVEQRHREQQSGPRSQKPRMRVGGRGPGRGQTHNAVAGGRGPVVDQRPVCFKCGGYGHIAKACPRGDRATRPVPVNVICFTCNQPGHYASSCPVTHPTGPSEQRVGLRALAWEDERAAKRPAIEGRVYSLDKPEPSRPNRGPVTGT